MTAMMIGCRAVSKLETLNWRCVLRALSFWRVYNIPRLLIQIHSLCIRIWNRLRQVPDSAGTIETVGALLMLRHQTAHTPVQRLRLCQSPVMVVHVLPASALKQSRGSLRQLLNIRL